MIELRHLRYFLAVAEELHFGRAAERLGIAQPPLTQQIQRLESMAGCKLFERSTRGTRLTPAGTVFTDYARRTVELAESGVEAARRASRGETGSLIIGTPPSLMLSALPKVIRRYGRRFPEVELSLREMSTAALTTALEAGLLDVAFLREPEPRTALTVDYSFEEPVVAVLPAGHALAKSGKLALQQLAAERFVFFPRTLGAAFHDRLLEFCRQAGFVPRIVQEARQWQSVVSLVEAGFGVTLGPACVERFRWPGVRFRRLRGLKTTVAVCRKADSANPCANAFIQMVRATEW